jgi:cytochrome c biogenesis protein CcmG/thiol:disulfide interchange protein DsbE
MSHRLFGNISLAAALPIAALVLATMLPASITERNSRKMAPEFVLDDSKGIPVRLTDFRGTVVLLDFWATWCHGCKIEIPWYVEFQKKYGDRGLNVIGVSMDDDGWKSVKPFLHDNNLNYPVVIGNHELAKQYRVDSMPVTLLIDRQGRIADSHSGMVDKNGFNSEIRRLLQEDPTRR